jgi:hypothetical protein
MQKSISLNRLHKFVERLTARNNQLRNDILQLTQPVTFQVTTGTVKLPIDQAARTKEAVDKLQEIFLISSTIYHIKASIMEANAKFRISALLAEQQQQNYGKGIAVQMKNMNDGYLCLSTSDVLQLSDGLSADSNPVSVAVAGIDESLSGKLDGIIEEYTTRINEISDKVSDLNKNEVTVEIPKSLLRVVGIVEE